MKLTTAIGREIDPGDPEHEFSVAAISTMQLLREVTYGLSLVHRFSGQLGPLTVAQHSVGVSSFFNSEEDLSGARLALIHDASEAYLGDVPTPLKRILPEYQRLELRYEEAIYARLLGGWPGDEIARVKEADQRAFQNEVYALVPNQAKVRYGTDGTYTGGYTPRILWGILQARELFYDRAIELGIAR